MPRPTKGPRLWLRPAREGRKAAWFILDGTKQIGTRCGAGEFEEARKRLGSYIAETYAPERRERRLADIPIADVISIYTKDVIAERPDAKKIGRRLDRLLDFWGEKTLADVTGANCRAYRKHRGNDGGARRDLQDLSAAIGHHHKEGFHLEYIRVALPKAGDARQRFLTRSELALLIRTCWRMREKQRRDHEPGKAADRRRKALPTDKFTMRHVARFLLVAYYTASRSGAVLTASWHAAAGRSYIDIGNGVFYRLADGGRITNKRQPPVRLPPRLLAHLRRWRDRKLCVSYPVEWQAEPVKSIKTAFDRAVTTANLGDEVSPHTIRHTAVTHMLQQGAPLWEAAGFAGMSEAMVRKHYGHHSPDHQAAAIAAISANETPKKLRNRERTNVNGTR